MSELPSLVLKRFSNFELLGSGGMGSVYRCFDQDLEAQVALKTTRVRDLAHLLRLKKEFRLRGDLHHPGLVNVHELFVSDLNCAFSMDLLEGVSLHSWIRGEEAPWCDSTLRPSVAPDLDLQGSAKNINFERLERTLISLLDALATLHGHGLVHRDVKPENVIVVDGRAVLVDFGLAHETHAFDLLGLDTSVIGTPGFMAPEQAYGAAVSGRADVYSLGLLLAVILTFLPPDQAIEQLTQLDVPVRYKELVARMTRHNPATRPSAASLYHELAGKELQTNTRSHFVGRETELSNWTYGSMKTKPFVSRSSKANPVSERLVWCASGLTSSTSR